MLTTKEKPAGRVDDPDLAEKMKAEVEGILLWAFEGLQRLAENNFKFTESQRTKENREAVKRDNNNAVSYTHLPGAERDSCLSAPNFVSDWIVNPAIRSVQKSPNFIYFRWLDVANE